MSNLHPGRPKTHDYTLTDFAMKLSDLQAEHKLSTEQVINSLKDKDGNPIDMERQVYDSYKSGKRLPQSKHFPEIIRAFADLYGVTSDYLLGIDENPSPQIKSVQDATGLSEASVRNLMRFNTEYPHIMKMIDAIIAGSTGEDILVFLDLYAQLYNEYKETHSDEPVRNYDAAKAQTHFLLMQNMFSYIKSVTETPMSEIFENDLREETKRHDYENTPEYIDNMNGFIRIAENRDLNENTE